MFKVKGLVAMSILGLLMLAAPHPVLADTPTNTPTTTPTASPTATQTATPTITQTFTSTRTPMPALPTGGGVNTLIDFQVTGPLLLMNQSAQIGSFIFSSVAGPGTLNIYDAASAAQATSANLKMSFPLLGFDSLSPSAGVLPTIPLDALFKNGVYIDAGTATISAALKVTAF
jgi:hypothetical protein